MNIDIKEEIINYFGDENPIIEETVSREGFFDWNAISFVLDKLDERGMCRLLALSEMYDYYDLSITAGDEPHTIKVTFCEMPIEDNSVYSDEEARLICERDTLLEQINKEYEQKFKALKSNERQS